MSFREIKEAVDQIDEANKIAHEAQDKAIEAMKAESAKELAAVKAENSKLLERVEMIESKGNYPSPAGSSNASAVNRLQAQLTEALEGDDFKALAQGRSSKTALTLRNVGPLLVKDTSFIGGDGYVGSPASGYPVAQARLAGVHDIRRPLDLLSQIPTVSAGPSNTLEFVRLGTESYSAGIQAAEGDLKTQVEYSFVLDSVPVRQYAAYAIASKQVLSDVQELRSFLTSRLAFDVRALLETQVVSGSSSSVSGLAEEAVAYAGSQTTAADRVGGAVAALRARGSGDLLVLMHPTDFQDIVAERTSGSGEYVAGGWAHPASPTLWGCPVTTSSSCSLNTALVFARSAAKLWVRDDITVELGFISDQFIRNQVTILCELRAAFAIVQPSLITSVAV